ncbi:hypothetical protein ARMGADRAFT_1081176 [Armillaria gallica]|uniref:Transmembrane protein n=1 Tax=Armillaria gallica TaxID=47427 RepID=A0A2H3DD77_ARMGA|nr:hypothetical protein ARMGADRAFT_1081176 [Armillaria gallica]
MVLFTGLLHHLVYFFIFSTSVYQGAMLVTDISRRWVDPVPVDVFTYGLPPANVTSVSMGDTLVQGVVALLEPIVVEAISPVAVLVADVYGVPRHTNDAVAIVASLDRPLAQGILVEPLKPIVVESICPVPIPEPSVTLATVDYPPPNQAFVQSPPIGLPPTVSPVPSNLTVMFVSSAFVVVVAALALVLRRASRTCQGSEVAEDIPLPDQTEQGTVSLWVTSVEPMINSASLPSGDFPYRNIFDLSGVSVRIQHTFEICQAEDTSVPRESFSAQDILSLYVTVPEQSSISQKMVEELDGVYNVSESIASAMHLVISEDDLRTMASTISFPPVNYLAQPTEFQKLCQAVFDELAGETQSMVPSLSLLSAADLGSVPLDLRSGLLESTGGFERWDLNWSTLTREAWVRDFWRRFLSDPDLAKLAYRALLPGDAPKTASTENVAEMSEALILSVPRSSSAQPSNSVLRFSSENPSLGDLEDEQSFESSAIRRNAHSPHLTPMTPSSSFARPSNLVLRCSDPDSSTDNLEVEESFGSSAVTPIRRGMSSPSRIPVACWRGGAFVPLVQVTRSARTSGPSSSRIPIRSGRALRFRMDVPSSISSLKPNRPKRCTPSRFPTVVPAVRRQEESGTPKRPARRCVSFPSISCVFDHPNVILSWLVPNTPLDEATRKKHQPVHGDDEDVNHTPTLPRWDLRDDQRCSGADGLWCMRLVTGGGLVR